jgi:hypothetical protein
MRMWMFSVFVAAAVGVGLGGCGRAAGGVAGPTTTSAVASALPIPVPSGSRIVYAVRLTAPWAGGERATVASALAELALTGDRRAFLACRAPERMRFVARLPVAVAQRWAGLLAGAHLARMRSDPPDPQGRWFTFADGEHIVHIDFIRHVHRAPCRGTECTAMLRLDSTIRALTPAMNAFNDFIVAHCSGA